jgi:hypothetical protein
MEKDVANMKTVKEILLEKIGLFDEKGNEYGHTYKEFEGLIEEIFGNEITVKKKYYNRFFIFSMILHKIKRISKTLLTDKVNVDSVKDIQVYAAMLEEIIYDK